MIRLRWELVINRCFGVALGITSSRRTTMSNMVHKIQHLTTHVNGLNPRVPLQNAMNIIVET